MEAVVTLKSVPTKVAEYKVFGCDVVAGSKSNKELSPSPTASPQILMQPSSAVDTLTDADDDNSLVFGSGGKNREAIDYVANSSLLEVYGLTDTADVYKSLVDECFEDSSGTIVPAGNDENAGGANKDANPTSAFFLLQFVFVLGPIVACCCSAATRGGDGSRDVGGGTVDPLDSFEV